MRVEGDENLIFVFATKLLTVLYKHSHIVNWLLTLTGSIISLLQDASNGNMAFVLSLAIATT